MISHDLAIYICILSGVLLGLSISIRSTNKLRNSKMSNCLKSFALFGFTTPTIMFSQTPAIAQSVVSPDKGGDSWLNSDVTDSTSIQNESLTETSTPFDSNKQEKPSIDIYEVKPGDSFWGIAQDRTSSYQELLSLWKRIIAENRGNIISGDPNLIYPGEEISIPN